MAIIPGVFIGIIPNIIAGLYIYQKDEWFMESGMIPGAVFVGALVGSSSAVIATFYSAIIPNPPGFVFIGLFPVMAILAIPTVNMILMLVKKITTKKQKKLC